MNATYPRAGLILDVLMEDFADGSGEQLVTIEAIPRSLEIVRNDHRTADTFRAELDFRQLPIDPRCVRSIRVRALLGDVGAPDVGAPDAQLSSDDKFWAFAGFVDVPKISLSESGDVVSLEGRDYTGVLLDAKWSGAAIDIKRSLGDVVADILDTVPGTDGLTVGYSRGAEALVLADVIGRTKFAPQAKDDTWTVLVDLCGRAGLIPVIELDMLLVLSPEDFGVDRATFLAGGEFAPNKATFLYGENLTKLEYERNFVEARTLQIEVRAFDEATRTTRTAKYPTASIVTKKRVSAKGKVTETAAPILPFYVSGAFTEAELSTQAERIYTEAARQQISGRLETKEMVDLTEGFDLPRLGNGDRIVVTLGDRLLTGIAGMSEAEAVAFLTVGRNALDLDVATALVNAFQQAEKLAVSFYVTSASHKWTRDDGYSLTVQFQNYVGGVA